MATSDNVQTNSIVRIASNLAHFVALYLDLRLNSLVKISGCWASSTQAARLKSYNDRELDGEDYHHFTCKVLEAIFDTRYYLQTKYP